MPHLNRRWIEAVAFFAALCLPFLIWLALQLTVFDGMRGSEFYESVRDIPALGPVLNVALRGGERLYFFMADGETTYGVAGLLWIIAIIVLAARRYWTAAALVYPATLILTWIYTLYLIAHWA